jgi:hypothetical protein
MTQFQELLSYMNSNLVIYYFSVPILLLNLFKLVKSSTHDKKITIIDIIISLFMVIGVVSGLIFQGALLDISNESTNPWVVKLIVIGIIDLVLFLIQFIFLLKNSHNHYK